MALHALLRAEAGGVRVRLAEDGTLQMEAASVPPAELVAMLREHRAALQALLHHDAGEAEAIAAFYAAPAGPILAQPDQIADGLLRGFWAHRQGTQQ